MELKFGTVDNAIKQPKSINRTKVELKFVFDTSSAPPFMYQSYQSGIEMAQIFEKALGSVSINRTKVELK